MFKTFKGTSNKTCFFTCGANPCLGFMSAEQAAVGAPKENPPALRKCTLSTVSCKILDHQHSLNKKNVFKTHIYYLEINLFRIFFYL